ncbi:MAG: hypothetical protein GC138_00235 [Gammaproteobacteria bacterium]|nr:hypothetical protein [Gammaproteobacteria bacterium]
MNRVFRTLPLAVAVSVCIVPGVRAAGLDDLDVTIQVIEHRERGAGEIINRIELPRPSAVESAVDSTVRREKRDSDRSEVERSVDGVRGASAVSSEVRQQSASVRESSGSARSDARESSRDLRSDSSQAAKDMHNDIRSSVRETSSDVRSSAKDSSIDTRSSIQDTSTDIKDATSDSVSDVRDQSSVGDARESATENEKD